MMIINFLSQAENLQLYVTVCLNTNLLSLQFEVSYFLLPSRVSFIVLLGAIEPI